MVQVTDVETHPSGTLRVSPLSSLFLVIEKSDLHEGYLRSGSVGGGPRVPEGLSGTEGRSDRVSSSSSST